MRPCSLMLVSLFVLTAFTIRGQDLTAAEYSQRGMARFEKNELDAAIADFTKAIELNGPDLEFCYYFRGIARYRRGNLDEAIADLGKAISIKRHHRFYDDRGNLLARKGDLDGALTDLNNAVEIAPQNAKGYCDRGIVRLMRGEDTQSELDFKKCFELDRTLEPQIRATASKIKQRAMLGSEREQPSDVKVIKFNWSETPTSVLEAEPSAIPVTTSAVSPTGTRVLANPDAKGPPGPFVVSDPAGVPPSVREPSKNPRTVISERFSVLIKNIGSKKIVNVQWAYFFVPKDTTHELKSYVFTSKPNLAPGKEKSFSELLPAASGPAFPNKDDRASFDERVVILRLEYADGTTWPGSKKLMVQ